MLKEKRHEKNELRVIVHASITNLKFVNYYYYLKDFKVINYKKKY